MSEKTVLPVVMDEIGKPFIVELVKKHKIDPTLANTLVKSFKDEWSFLADPKRLKRIREILDGEWTKDIAKEAGRIRKELSANRTEIPDIAPTIATLLGVAFPNGTTGKPIVEVLE